MTVLINASNSSGLTITSDTSGNIAIQSQGTTVATISGTGANAGIQVASFVAPAFSAYINSSSLSVTANTDIKIPFDTKLFDTANCFNTSTNRFTPNVAGYYQFSIGIQPEGSTSQTRIILILNKNGSNDAVLQDFATSTLNKTSGTKLVYMNGTTDYVEGHCYIIASAAVLSGGIAGNWFTGAMVRSA